MRSTVVLGSHCFYFVCNLTHRVSLIAVYCYEHSAFIVPPKPRVHFSSSQEGFSPNSIAACMISSMPGAPIESFFARTRPSLRVLCASRYMGQIILFEFFAIVQ